MNDLDRAIGSKPGYISRVESDIVGSVGSVKLQRIAAKLRVSLDWLVSGHGDLEGALIEESIGRRVREKPGWTEALLEGRRRYATIEDRFWLAAGELAGPGLPERVDVAFVAALARALQEASASGLDG